MKKTKKTLAAVLLIATMLFCAQVMTFATVDASSEDEAGESTSAVESAAEETTDDADEAGEEDATATSAEDSGDINASPNTGVTAAPIAAALLAAAAVPVMIKSRKK